MMIGTMIVFVWRAFFRRGGARCSRKCSRKVADREIALGDEKSGLMEHQEEIGTLHYIEAEIDDDVEDQKTDVKA